MQAGWAALIALGIRVLEALALWIVGRWLIGFALRLIGRGMTRQKVSPFQPQRLGLMSAKLM